MKMRHRKKATDRGLRAHVAVFMWPGYSIKAYMKTRVLALRWVARIHAKIQTRRSMLKNRGA